MTAEREQQIKENQLKAAAAKYNITVPIQLEKYRKISALAKSLKIEIISLIDGSFSFSNVPCGDCPVNNGCFQIPKNPAVCYLRFLSWALKRENNEQQNN
jgi:hypothetical protein